MRRTLLLLISIALTCIIYAQEYTDTIISDFETGLQGATSWGADQPVVVPNPLKDAVNSSDNVLHFVGKNWTGVVIHFDSTKFRNYFAKVVLNLFLTRPVTFNGHLDGGYATPLDYHGNHSANDVGRWLTINFDMPAPADMGYKQIWFRTGDSTNIYIDNVGFLEVNPGQVSSFEISKVVAGEISSTLDFSADIKMRWDNDSIYNIFTVHDDTIVNTGGTNYQQDNIEYYIDLNNSKNAHWPRNGNYVSAVDPTFDANDYQLRLNPNQDFAINNLVRPLGSSINSGYFTNYERTDFGYVYKLNIAWKALDPTFIPSYGKFIGVDANISDADSQVVNDANRNQITWNSPTTNLFNDPSLWATLQLRQGGLFVQIPDNEKPSAPANIWIAVAHNIVTLYWDAANDNIAVLKYIVFNGNDSVTSVYAKQSLNSFTFPVLTDGNYTLGIASADNSGNLSDIATVNVTVPSVIIAGDTSFSISRVVYGSVTGPVDFSAYLKMKWDSDSLYSKFVVTDDSIVNTGTSYQVDNIEFYIDINNSKNVHYPRNGPWVTTVDSAFDSTDYQIRLVPDVPFTTNNMSRPSGTSIESGYNQKFVKTTNGYTFDLNIAWKTLMRSFNPTVETRIGIDVLISDNDNAFEINDANRNQITLESHTDKPFNDPSLWGTFEFTSGGLLAKIDDSIAPSEPDNLFVNTNNNLVTLQWDTASDNVAVLRYIIYNGSDSVASVYGKMTGNSYTFSSLPVGNHTIGIIVVDNSENKSAMATINVSVNTNDLNGTSVVSFNMSPNPVANYININSNKKINKIYITDLAGQIVTSIIVNTNNVTINLSNLKGGMYLVKIETTNGTSVKKMLKRKI